MGWRVLNCLIGIVLVGVGQAALHPLHHDRLADQRMMWEMARDRGGVNSPFKTFKWGLEILRQFIEKL